MSTQTERIMAANRRRIAGAILAAAGDALPARQQAADHVCQAIREHVAAGVCDVHVTIDGLTRHELDAMADLPLVRGPYGQPAKREILRAAGGGVIADVWYVLDADEER